LNIGPQAECIAETGGKPLYPDLAAAEALKDHHWFKNQ
jgi:hypothetical protein